MRTTINLPDGLAEAAKRKARGSGRTFTSLVEDGLRRVLEEGDTREAPIAPRLPTYGDSEAHPLIDLDDRDAVGEVLDADGLR